MLPFQCAGGIPFRVRGRAARRQGCCWRTCVCRRQQPVASEALLRTSHGRAPVYRMVNAAGTGGERDDGFAVDSGDSSRKDGPWTRFTSAIS